VYFRPARISWWGVSILCHTLYQKVHHREGVHEAEISLLQNAHTRPLTALPAKTCRQINLEEAAPIRCLPGAFGHSGDRVRTKTNRISSHSSSHHFTRNLPKRKRPTSTWAVELCIDSAKMSAMQQTCTGSSISIDPLVYTGRRTTPIPQRRVEVSFAAKVAEELANVDYQ